MRHASTVSFPCIGVYNRRFVTRGITLIYTRNDRQRSILIVPSGLVTLLHQAPASNAKSLSPIMQLFRPQRGIWLSPQVHDMVLATAGFPQPTGSRNTRFETELAQTHT